MQVASGSAIELTFTDIDIEPHGSCDYDYVQVLISNNIDRSNINQVRHLRFISFPNQVLNTDNSQLVKACGTTKPAVLKSTGNKMTVVFHRSEANEDGGGDMRMMLKSRGTE